MNENTKMLECMYKESKMAIKSIQTLLDTINDKENKIQKETEKILKGYEKSLKEINKLIKKYDVEVTEENMITKASSWMGIKMELMKDNSDGRIADMLIKGLTMGSIEITKKIDSYKDSVSKDILKVAQEFKQFQEDSIIELKNYL